MSPPLAVLATLVLVLVVPRRVPLWVSFLVAGFLLPVLCGKGIAESARLWTVAATDDRNLIFTGICAGVFVLSSILTHGGHLAALCDVASATIPSRRFRAALMPAVVGLVPMPGGAVVSAPLIDRSLGDVAVDPTDKNLINYWFRHIWEVSWPLYPAVALAAGYLDHESPTFLAAQAPLTAVLAIAGWFALLRRVPVGAPEARKKLPLASLRAAIPLLVLVGVPIAAWRGGPWEWWAVPVAAIALAILAAVLTTIRFPGLAKVPTDGRIYAMTLLAYLIQVFGDLVEATGASGATAQALAEAGLPLWVPALTLPFLVGFATGATLTFVAVAFPIVIPHLRDGSASPLPWLVLAYAGGFVGYLTSPVHMCLVLSTRYFNSKLLSAYARLAVPICVFLTAAVILFTLLGGRFHA